MLDYDVPLYVRLVIDLIDELWTWTTCVLYRLNYVMYCCMGDLMTVMLYGGCELDVV